MALLPIIIVIFIAVFLLFFILKDLGMMSVKQKILGGIILFILSICIGIYSYHKSKSDEKTYLLQMSFLRGENIICNHKIINAKHFNLVTGTLTLIGKENSPAKNLVYSLQDCQQDKQENKSDKNQNLQQQLEKD